MINKFTRYLRQKFRGDHRSRTRHNSSQACSTSPRRVILSLLLLAVLGYSFALRLDIGLGPFLRHLYVRARYWAWPPPIQFERRAQLAPTDIYILFKKKYKFTKLLFLNTLRYNYLPTKTKIKTI